MISINVQKRLGSFRIRADFKAKRAGITALFGPSGTGKTTIVNMMAGLVRPDRGRISVNGHILFDAERRIDSPPEKRRIGCVFQDSRLFPHLSVRGNLIYGMKLVPPDDRYAAFDRVVDVLEIAGLLKRRPRHLSGGEKQRVAIGRALLASPRLLLMDEPLSSVDHALKAEILKLIAAVPKKFSVPVVYVTHDPTEIDRIAQKVVLVRDGRTEEVEKQDDWFDRLRTPPGQ